MKAFTLRLQDATRITTIPEVVSFVGEDASGSFGILAGCQRFSTILVTGLARFRIQTGSWSFIALPGGVLHFVDNTLTLNTSHYFIDDDYTRISQSLLDQLVAEEERTHTLKESLHNLESQTLKRLWELGRESGG